jgi:hypothetical protein
LSGLKSRPLPLGHGCPYELLNKSNFNFNKTGMIFLVKKKQKFFKSAPMLEIGNKVQIACTPKLLIQSMNFFE